MKTTKTMNTDTATTVDALRREISAVIASIQATDAAPVPLVEAEMSLTSRLDELVSLYDTSGVTLFTRHADASLSAIEALIPDPRWDPRLVRAFLAAVCRDELLGLWLERLRQVYAAEHVERAAIPTSERPQRLAALRERLHQLCVDEEVAIMAAWQRGMVIDRRGDIEDVSVLFVEAALPVEVLGA